MITEVEDSEEETDVHFGAGTVPLVNFLRSIRIYFVTEIVFRFLSLSIRFIFYSCSPQLAHLI